MVSRTWRRFSRYMGSVDEVKCRRIEVAMRAIYASRSHAQLRAVATVESRAAALPHARRARGNWSYAAGSPIAHDDARRKGELAPAAAGRRPSHAPNATKG